MSHLFDSVLSMVQSQSCCFFKRNANIFKRWKHLSNSDTIKGFISQETFEKTFKKVPGIKEEQQKFVEEVRIRLKKIFVDCLETAESDEGIAEAMEDFEDEMKAQQLNQQQEQLSVAGTKIGRATRLNSSHAT